MTAILIGTALAVQSGILLILLGIEPRRDYWSDKAEFYHLLSRSCGGAYGPLILAHACKLDRPARTSSRPED